MRVLIVDDHEMFAESLARLIASHDEASVRHCAAVSESESAAREHQPEVAIVDWNLPDGTGASVIRRVRTAAPDCKVVVLTGTTAPGAVHTALDAGADGFLTKDRAADELFAAIDTVMRGEVSLSADALTEVLRARREDPPAAVLSDRELQILERVAAGESNKDIAAELFLSVNTVRNHIQRISQKLGAHSRLDAVVTAVQFGLIELPVDPA